MDNLQIRQANEKDVSALAHLMTELGYPTTEQEMKQRFSAIAIDPAYTLLIAEWNGEVAGMAGALKSLSFEQNGCYVRIGVLVTKGSFRQKGVGKALVQAVENWAKQFGATAIVLNCGNREERNVAHQFYPGLGFEAKSTGYVKRLV